MPSRSWSDQTIEILLSKLLRAGVLLSAAVVSIGAVIYLVHHGSSSMDFGAFRGEPAEFRTIRGIIRATIALRGRGIIQLGLLLLIATPVARVALSIVGFAEERDRLYVGLTSIVFVILMYSLLVSV
jgi:uncharacterized membrane protein